MGEIFNVNYVLVVNRILFLGKASADLKLYFQTFNV